VSDDVTPVGFAATDAPGAFVRRRRNPLWLVITLLLVVASIGGIAWFGLEQVGSAPGAREAVASGRVAALGAATTAAVRVPAGEHTVWLDLGGVTLSNNRDTIVAATNCELQPSGARFRGAIQGASVEIGSKATVGTFTAPAGGGRLACHMEPFGRLRGRHALRAERPFLVVPGKPGAPWLSWVAAFAAIPLLMLAWVAASRWRAGRLALR